MDYQTPKSTIKSSIVGEVDLFPRIRTSASMIWALGTGVRKVQRLLTVQKLNGTVVTQGGLILSSDGRSITEETWKPGAPKAKTRLVYEK